MKACIFIERETPTQVFFCEYCEIFKNSFFMEHLLFIILFQNLCDDRILWMPSGTKLYFSCFLCQWFVFLHNSSVRIGNLFLFFCTCFHIKNFCKCNFCKHCNVGFSSILLIELLKFRNIPRIIMLSPGFLL